MNHHAKSVTIRITRAAVIAAVYTALCWSTGYLSWGPIQFRIAEALTLLPLIFPESIVGVTVGCLLANLLGSGIILDVAIGTLTTFVAALTTGMIGHFVRHKIVRVTLGCLPPVLFNAFIIPFVLMAIGFDNGMGYWILVATTGGGQLVAVCAIGIPFYFGLATTMGLIKTKHKPRSMICSEGTMNVPSSLPSTSAEEGVQSPCPLQQSMDADPQKKDKL